VEVSFTLWSLKEVLEKIPFDSPAQGPVDLDFSDIAAPYYIKHGFKVSILYEESLPYEACCSIYSPGNVVTVVIIIKKCYEEALAAWMDGNTGALDGCCMRRELYCHEACHLVAIIRAYPSDRSSHAREDFVKKLKGKFTNSVNKAEGTKAVLLVSMEKPGSSPSFFDNDHFRYGNDSLNYFRLYQELMLNHEKMAVAVKTLCVNTAVRITFEDVAQETFVSDNFFKVFPEKWAAFIEMLIKDMSGHIPESANS
jgi:hypothetical protein